jgi:hypothetical protein
MSTSSVYPIASRNPNLADWLRLEVLGLHFQCSSTDVPNPVRGWDVIGFKSHS